MISAESVKDVIEIFPKEAEKIYKQVSPADSSKQTVIQQYEERKTYSQNWSTYEKAMSEEKLMFLKLLKDAVDFMQLDYEYKGNGRPPAYYADLIKALCIKSYNNYSSWRVESELKIAKSLGIIEEVYKRPTLNKYMQDPTIATQLHKLYKIIAEPLCEVETHFSADATGISNSYGNTRWMQIRHTKEEAKHRREYSKLHIITGRITNVITSAKVTIGTAHESPHFPSLLDDTAKIFNVKEVSADAGYLSKDNVKAIDKHKATPYIAGKRNVSVPPNRGRMSSWGNMLRQWKYNQFIFGRKYHLRSNVETTFSMIKRRFGDFCRSKKLQSQENEILCKIVCHNVVVLAAALLEHNLTKGFIAT